MKLLNLLTKEELTYLKYLYVKQNQIIFHENQKATGVFYVQTGEIQIISYTKNGNEELISIVKEHDFFANALIFSSSPYFLGEIIAKKDTKIIYIEKNNLIKILQNNKEFLEQYINTISEKTIKLTQKNKLLSHKNIRERIIYYLEIHNKKIKKNITQLAKELILPRPSVSREISKMINENIIKIENNYLILIYS